MASKPTVTSDDEAELGQTVKPKHRKSVSPTQRTLKYLRDLGYVCAITEHWNAFTRRREDLFHWIDLIAIRQGDGGVWGIQTTTTSNLNARLKKAANIPELKAWLLANNTLSIITWAKRGGRGKRKLWTMVERKVTLEDLNDNSEETDNI